MPRVRTVDCWWYTMMRVAFLSGGSVDDRGAWSGTIYSAYRALTRHFDVVPLETPRVRSALRGLRRVLRPFGVDPLREPLGSDLLAEHLARRVQAYKPAAVFSLAASHLAAGLADRVPVFHCSDATFAGMLDYHADFTQLSRRIRQAGHALERRAVQNSVATIVSSEWAAESIRRDYQRSDGVHVVPFGANLDELPAADVWQRAAECRLVFVGVNWSAKGADIAVNAVRILNERGIRSTLDVVGCLPPPEWQAPPFVRCHGFLRKQVTDEYRRLAALLASADFFILPTRFEAFGIVFCEAAAYGTPAIAPSRGGIPTIIEDGITGALVPAEAGPDLYADRIQELWSNEAAYAEMRRRAFARSRSTLNWDAWGERVSSIMQEALAHGGAAPGYQAQCTCSA